MGLPLLLLQCLQPGEWPGSSWLCPGPWGSPREGLMLGVWRRGLLGWPSRPPIPNKQRAGPTVLGPPSFTLPLTPSVERRTPS